LLDSLDLLLDCMQYAFAGRPIAPTRAQWTEGIGTPLRQQMREWQVAEHELEQVVARYRAHQDAHLERMTSLFPGALDVLQWARSEQVPVGVVTSKGRGMTTRSLRHVGLADAFDVIITADDTTRHKPDPLPVQQALQQLGIVPDRALFVGDSTHDMHAGRRAGTFTGAVGPVLTRVARDHLAEPLARYAAGHSDGCRHPQRMSRRALSGRSAAPVAVASTVERTVDMFRPPRGT
jgi:pyrophosphatase PpaX